MSLDSVVTIAPLLTGPGSSVIVLFALLVCCGLFFWKCIVPLVQRLADRHFDQFDQLLDQHKEANDALIKELRRQGAALGEVVGRLTDVEETLEVLKSRGP